jgi:triacylglycerol lipase
MHHVFLVPGFFGFANLGNLVYFAHVREALVTRLGHRGLQVAVHAVPTDPTASLPARARKLLDAIETAGVGQQDDVHLVGHSTGGLDARLLASPGVALPDTTSAEPLARRVRTVVTVATPHRGTAVASFFNSLLGQQLLGLLSVATIYTLRHGPLPLSILLRLGALFARLDDHFGFRNTVVDHLFDELLRDFTPERRQAVEDLLSQMRQDSSLLGQLTPEGAVLLNALAIDRRGTRYASVVCATRPPGLRSLVGVGLNPYAQATHALYLAVYRITARTPGASLASFPTAQRASFIEQLGFAPDDTANDGIVPLASQPWGEVIHAANADHLDVIGHFAGEALDPPHRDWFASGSSFRRSDFDALWNDVADFLAR